MDDLHDMDDEEYEEQIERMIVENGMMLRGLANLLVRKGILTQEELDDEMDRLYEEMEEYEDENGRE